MSNKERIIIDGGRKSGITILQVQLARKTQECEELKKQLEFVRTHRTVIDAEKERYRKALGEIKTIAEGNKDCCFECKPMIKILDIISKVKGD